MGDADYRQQLEIRRRNIIPVVQIILNSVYVQPRSIPEIRSSLATHGHSRSFTNKGLKTLFDKINIVGIPTLCSPDKPGNKTSKTWKYGLIDKIVSDFEGEPDACEYINRTSWYLRQTIDASNYKCLNEQ